ncbi:hypothetical protein AX774_g1052 [Zancudomyces culisetae]|uniref:Uncharacterized protein n=1 Tax=Zancudomyces culisetae TaxID=1213189 RepID=A0A1R1PWR8_ZANCU|nr:hypothetical protein AX774_g1052 [Zancudomyces culisetae]|eukprot:OMH85401.1 hypothetical protein AX774_g1052 [Zancudomyces culisetae]
MSVLLAELKVLHRNYNRVASKWPIDRLRPTYNLSESLKQYAEERFNKKAYDSKEEMQTILDNGKSNLASLERILNNDAKNKYPLSSRITSPSSDPKYYSKLIDHVEDVVSGKARKPGNWFINFLSG